MIEMTFVRPASKVKAPTVTAGEVVKLQKPPMTPLPPPASGFQRFGPVLLVVALGFMIVMGMKSGAGGRPIFSGFGLTLPLMLLMGGGMMFARRGGRGGGGTANTNKERSDYARYIDEMRERARVWGQEQFMAARFHYPPPEALSAMVNGPRMWERRPGMTEFATVRLGRGVERANMSYDALEIGALEDQEPACVEMAESFIQEHTFVRDVPKAINMLTTPVWSCVGDAQRLSAAVRAMLMHMAFFHGPDDLAIVVIGDAQSAREFEWLKWLPHHRRGVLSARMLSYRSAQRFIDDFGPAYRDRGFHSGGSVRASSVQVAAGDMGGPGGGPGAGRHLVLVCVGAEVDWPVLLLEGRPVAGVSVFDLTPNCPLRDPAKTLVFRAEGDSDVLRWDPDAGRDGVAEFTATADQVSAGEAEAFARRLAPYRPGSKASAILDAAGESSSSIDLGELLSIEDWATFDVYESWRWSENHRNFLRVPVGRYLDTGRTWYLDLKEDDLSNGPHLGLAGSTGSGKSELLRVLVWALVCTHSPEDLVITACDFKGNQTFRGLEKVPHVLAVLHNLDNDRDRIARVLQVFQGELIKRQQMLDHAATLGEECKDIYDYRRLRRRKPQLNLAPMPHWFIPFDELMQAKRDFPELLTIVAIVGTVGRSLGAHVMPVSQTFQVVGQDIDTHIRGRIGLKMNDSQDYKPILGSSNPGALPRRKGVGYFVEDKEAAPQRVEACYISGPYVPPVPDEEIVEEVSQEPQLAPRMLTAVRDEVAARIEIARDGAPTADTELDAMTADDSAGSVDLADDLDLDDMGFDDEDDGDREAADLVSNFRVGIDHMSDVVKVRPRPMWLPELLSYTPVSAYAARMVREVAGIRDDLSRLVAPCGIVDIPREHAQETLAIDLLGNVGLSGAAKAGKTSALLAMMMGAACLYSPERVQFYCLDMGGGDLGPAAALAHVGEVVPGVGNDYGVERLMNHLQLLIRQRSSRWAAAGVHGASAWRARRFGPDAADAASVDDGYGDVFLILDGADVFARQYADRIDELLSIAQTGPGVGVHLVLTVNSWTAASMYKFWDTFSRYELRQGEFINSIMGSYAAQAVPTFPGRGLVSATGTGLARRAATVTMEKSIPAPESHHLLFAAPWVALESVNGQVRELDTAGSCAQINAMYPSAAPAAALPVLPSSLRLADLPIPDAAPADVLWVGLRESDQLAQQFSPADDGHLVVLGEKGCGRTATLEVLGAQLAAKIASTPPPLQPLVYVFDTRQGLLGTVPGARQYVYEVGQAGAAVAEIHGLLASRSTGGTLSQEELLRLRAESSQQSYPDIYVLVDNLSDFRENYGDAFDPLAGFVERGAAIGFHVIASQIAEQGIMQTRGLLPLMRRAGAPVLLMSTDPSLVNLVGKQRGQKLPPGRGLWLGRDDRMMVQVAQND